MRNPTVSIATCEIISDASVKSRAYVDVKQTLHSLQCGIVMPVRGVLHVTCTLYFLQSDQRLRDLKTSLYCTHYTQREPCNRIAKIVLAIQAETRERHCFAKLIRQIMSYRQAPGTQVVGLWDTHGGSVRVHHGGHVTHGSHVRILIAREAVSIVPHGPYQVRVRRLQPGISVPRSVSFACLI